LHDNGAYDPYGLTVPINTQCTLLGPYHIPTYYSEFKVVFTNKTIVTPYRGAGRQHGVFIIERLMDLAAKELGLDRNEIRQRNFIPPEAFPYENQLIYQDFAPLVYDSGNYEPLLDKALDMIGYQEFVNEIQPKLRQEGKQVGIGVVVYVEGTGIGPYEGARVQVESTGKVSVATGIGTQGQGHFTSFAQVVAEHLGVPVTDIEVTTGDTDLFHWGTGTFASRGATVAGNAVNEAAKDVRLKILKLANDLLEAAEEDLELVDGEVRVKGVPHRAIPLGELAAKANPLRGAVQPGTEPGLESTNYFGPKTGGTASYLAVLSWIISCPLPWMSHPLTWVTRKHRRRLIPWASKARGKRGRSPSARFSSRRWKTRCKLRAWSYWRSPSAPTAYGRSSRKRWH
jgi:CO/xanthine dehydrogenase Mo-binding subunit